MFLLILKLRRIPSVSSKNHLQVFIFVRGMNFSQDIFLGDKQLMRFIIHDQDQVKWIKFIYVDNARLLQLLPCSPCSSTTVSHPLESVQRRTRLYARRRLNPNLDVTKLKMMLVHLRIIHKPSSSNILAQVATYRVSPPDDGHHAHT